MQSKARKTVLILVYSQKNPRTNISPRLKTLHGTRDIAVIVDPKEAANHVLIKKMIKHKLRIKVAIKKQRPKPEEILKKRCDDSHY